MEHLYKMIDHKRNVSCCYGDDGWQGGEKGLYTVNLHTMLYVQYISIKKRNDWCKFRKEVQLAGLLDTMSIFKNKLDFYITAIV